MLTKKEIIQNLVTFNDEYKESISCEEIDELDCSLEEFHTIFKEVLFDLYWVYYESFVPDLWVKEVAGEDVELQKEYDFYEEEAQSWFEKKDPDKYRFIMELKELVKTKS